jgi:hypothetical protein
MVCLAAVSGITWAGPGLNAWPSKVELFLSAGEKKGGQITIQNQGLSKISMQAVALNFTMDRDGELNYTDKNLSFGLKDWLTVEPSSFEVNPRSSQQVHYEITVPHDAQGARVGAVLFLSSGVDQSGDAYQRSIGTIILQTVAGTGIKSADLTELAIHRKEGVLNAKILVDNTGNLIIKPAGHLAVSDAAGKQLGVFPINTAGELVLPQSAREYNISLAGIGEGGYRLLATIDYGGNEILQGEAFFSSGGKPNAFRAPSPGKSSQSGQPPALSRLSGEEFDSMLKEGIRLYADGNYQKSMDIWQKLIRADPNHAKVKQYLERTRQKLEALKRSRD